MHRQFFFAKFQVKRCAIGEVIFGALGLRLGAGRAIESLVSLIPMAKINASLTHLAQKGLLFSSVLTGPTRSGVSAGFSFLGAAVIAKPKALIGFAGPRVNESTVRMTLPEGGCMRKKQSPSALWGLTPRQDRTCRIAPFAHAHHIFSQTL